MKILLQKDCQAFALRLISFSIVCVPLFRMIEIIIFT